MNLNNLSSSSWKVDGPKNWNWRLYFLSERDAKLLKTGKRFSQMRIIMYIIVLFRFVSKLGQTLGPTSTTSQGNAYYAMEAEAI